MRRLLVVALVVGLVVACGGGGKSGSSGSGAGTATPPASKSSTASGASAASPSPAASQPAGSLPSVKLQRVFSQLTFKSLTGLYQVPDGRWFALEQAGRLLEFPDTPNARATEVMDLTDRATSEGAEEGLLGFAAAPDFPTGGVFYLYYTAPNPLREVLSRFRMQPGGGDVAASEQVLLEVADPFPNHNGGQLAFGPDGYLYLGLGDGGSARDPQHNGQNLNTLLAKILRIDVSGGGASYAVPPDNPFAGQKDARGEIWAYGMRNPWRFSFDKTTGELWVGDVGQDTREEVDVVTKGGDYGWSIMEGSQCLGGGSNCNRDGLLLPVFDYANQGQNCAITGGFVYRGQTIGGLQGAYVFADYCSGIVWALRKQGSSLAGEGQIADAPFMISSFAQGNDGELYVLEYSPNGGGIYKLTP
jgi:glucose/arabinose dehydrogenase